MAAHKKNRKCSVAGCDAPHVAHGYCTKHYQRRKFHGDAMWEPPSDAERFWGKVEKRSDSECWRWCGSLFQRKPYGQFSLRGGTVLAHRFSYELANGPIPDGMLVCHSCDNPSCVNPGHLWLGGHADNMRDRDTKGRQARGIRQAFAKLTPPAVRAIRVRYVELGADRWGAKSAEVLALEFGVSTSAVWNVLSGHTWSHVR